MDKVKHNHSINTVIINMNLFNVMYKIILCVFFMLLAFNNYSQSSNEKRKNLSKRQTFYYDPLHKTKVESYGYYYVDELGETTERHGKWSFFNEEGVLVEERHYHRNKLEGEVKTYFGKDRIKNIGYFKEGLQDSLFVEFYITGDTSEVGYYHLGNPTGTWSAFW